MAKEKKTLYTQQGYDELVAELKRREGVEREKIKKDIEVAKGFGDLSENAEYSEARRMQSENETRILELKEKIENAEIVDESTLDIDVVNLGSIVKVQNNTTGIEVTYSIVGSNESDPVHGKISDLSPVGAALMGKRAGDRANVETPNGLVKLTVLDVKR
ncbi:MAG: transcription elongation factor GreA [Clostridia bacterium]|nr:transcription elongation factor GreA [Clostridia bacterium]